MRLSELKTGETGVVVKILGHGAFRKRVMEMGFVKGQEIKSLLNAPLNDPIKYSIMGYELSLRRSEADLVEVVRLKACDMDARPRAQQGADMSESMQEDTDGSAAADPHEHARRTQRTINIALVGNPNCGKTSLFNIASGAKEHVGNYSGVTVDAKRGHFSYGGYRFNIVDLPGTYSLACYSPEELYVRRYLRDEMPDIVVNVVVASNLERNLYLTTELIDMDRSMVIALNMYDELEHSGATLDYRMLGEMIGVPMVPTVSRTGEGLHNLFDTIIRVYEGKEQVVRHVHVNLGPEIEPSVTMVKDAIKADPAIGVHFSPRYLAIKLLEHDSEVEAIVKESPDHKKLLELRDRCDALIEKRTGAGRDICRLNQRESQDHTYHRRLCHQPSVWLPDIPRHHALHVLVHIRDRLISHGMDRERRGVDSRPGGDIHARRTAERPRGRRHNRRCRRCHRVPAQYPHPLFLHIVYGGLWLHGPRGVHHG